MNKLKRHEANKAYMDAGPHYGETVTVCYADDVSALEAENERLLEERQRLDLGNLEVIVETMECRNTKLPYGCPNCKGLDFCLRSHARKTIAALKAYKAILNREQEKRP